MSDKIRELQYYSEANSKEILKLIEKIAELKDQFNEHLHGEYRLREVLRELGDKLIGWQSEKQTDYDKKCFATSLKYTLEKLEGKTEKKCSECIYSNGSNRCWATKGFFDPTSPLCDFISKKASEEK